MASKGLQAVFCMENLFGGLDFSVVWSIISLTELEFECMLIRVMKNNYKGEAFYEVQRTVYPGENRQCRD